MRYHFHTISAHAWDAMLAAIKHARQSIYWESYILLDDTPIHDFFEALKEKARQGVRVKIIADALGSFQLKAKTVNELTAAGAEVLFFNHLVPWWNIRRFRYWWFCRNHKKILVVDEEIGFIGGVNVGRQFASWLDLQVELRGLIVRSLVRSFVKSYRRCGGRDRFILQRVRIPKTKLHLLDHWPSWRRQRTLKIYYQTQIRRARTRIVMATPYFIPHPWLIALLRAAARRGVTIDLVLPRATDWKLVTLANYIFASLVVSEKINFYFTGDMIHAKCLLIDDEEGVVGTHNIDAQSFDYNAETFLIFQRKDMIRDLKRILQHWQEHAERLVFHSQRRRWYQRLLEGIFVMLQPIL